MPQATSALSVSGMEIVESPDWGSFTQETYKPFVVNTHHILVVMADWGGRETWRQFRARLHSMGLWEEAFGKKAAMVLNGESSHGADERVRQLYPAPWGYVPPLSRKGQKKKAHPMRGWGAEHPVNKRGRQRIEAAFGNEMSSARLSKDDFKDKPKVDETKAIRWVADNISFTDVNLKDAPSGFAADMLKWARASEENKREFYLNILPKVMPVRGKGEEVNTFEDDGRVLDGLIDKVLKGEHGSGPEESGG